MDKQPIKRRIQGIVVSDKMTKTRVVAVSGTRKHPKYQRLYRVTKRFKAHDEENAYKMGDVVIIEETRPLSKEKRFKIVEKIK